MLMPDVIGKWGPRRRGNVDDTDGCGELPEHAMRHINGWRVLVTHIIGMPPKGE